MEKVIFVYQKGSLVYNTNTFSSKEEYRREIELLEKVLEETNYEFGINSNESNKQKELLDKYVQLELEFTSTLDVVESFNQEYEESFKESIRLLNHIRRLNSQQKDLLLSKESKDIVKVKKIGGKINTLVNEIELNSHVIDQLNQDKELNILFQLRRKSS